MISARQCCDWCGTLLGIHGVMLSRLALRLGLERLDIKFIHHTEQPYTMILSFMLRPEPLRFAAQTVIHSLAAYRSELAFG